MTKRECYFEAFCNLIFEMNGYPAKIRNSVASTRVLTILLDKDERLLDEDGDPYTSSEVKLAFSHFMDGHPCYLFNKEERIVYDIQLNYDAVAAFFGRYMPQTDYQKEEIDPFDIFTCVEIVQPEPVAMPAEGQFANKLSKLFRHEPTALWAPYEAYRSRTKAYARSLTLKQM